MRIAVLTSLYPGPPQPFEGIFAERRWRTMAARGHEVAVVQPLPRTPGPFARGRWARIAAMPGEERRSGIEIRRPRYLHLPQFGRAGVAIARRNARAFARIGLRTLFDWIPAPDAVVADYAWPAAMAAEELHARGIPFLINGRGSDVVQVAESAGLGEDLSRALRRAGHWCALSHDLVARLDRLGGAPGRGHLVPNGVDRELFHPRDRAEARRRLQLPGSGSIVLVVGYLIERKDPLLALEAFARAAGDGAHCCFVGRGPLHDALLARATELGIAERVRLVGEVQPDQLAWWYAAADCLVITSKREGRPNVVLEALASGRPVVATTAGGTAEILEGEHERMLVTERSVEAVAGKLAGILAAPPATEDLCAMVEHLSWEKSCDALERCLAETIAEGGRSA